MNNPYDKAFVEFFSTLPHKKWVIYAAGGILTVGVGGCLVYNHLKKRRFSSDIPVDPDHVQNTSTLIAEKSDQLTKKCTDPLIESNRIKNEGNKFFKQSEYQKAIEFYSQAIQVCPPLQKSELSILYQNRAAAYEKIAWFKNKRILAYFFLDKSRECYLERNVSNDDASVLDDCSRALVLNSRHMKALNRRGNLHEKNSRWREASYDYMKCCILQNFAVEETVKRASKCLQSMSKAMAKEYLEKRRAENRPVPLSKTIVRATIRSFGCDPVFSKFEEMPDEQNHVLHGHNGFSEGKQSGALTNVETAVRLVKAQKYEESIEICSQEINLARKSTDLVRCLLIRSFFYNLTARFDEVRNDLHKALKILEELTATKDAKVDDELIQLKCSVFTMFGFLEHLAGNLNESLQYLDEAEKLWPDNADIFSLRGQIRSLNNVDPKLSHGDFAKSVQLKPSFVHYQVQLLAAEIKKASEEQNSMLLTSILDRVKDLLLENPRHIEANMFFAQVMLEMENFSLAIEHLEKAARLDPNSADIIAQMAFIDITNDRQESAVEAVHRALEIDPHCLAALEIMAQYHSKRSDLPKMMDCYNKALEVARSEAEASHFFNMRETTLMNMQMAEEFLT